MKKQNKLTEKKYKQKTNKTESIIKSLKKQNDALETFLQKLQKDLSVQDNQIDDDNETKL